MAALPLVWCSDLRGGCSRARCHSLQSILSIAVLAVIGGINSRTEVELSGEITRTCPGPS
jgi:hypothetical protein